MNTRIRGNSQIMDFSIDLDRLKKPFLTTSTGDPTDWNITDGAQDALITGIKLQPANDSDVTSKWYVDQQNLLGIEWKLSVQFATSTGIVGATYTSTGGTVGSGAFTDVDFTQYFDIDSHTVLVGDRVLVMHQTDQKQNGIYIITSTGVAGGLERAADQDGQPSSEVSIGNATYVESGDTFGGTHWVTVKPIGYDGTGVLALNTDDIIWAQFSGIGTYTAGDGIDIISSAISVDVTDIVGAGLYDDGFNNLAVSYGGTGSASSAAHSDHTHSYTYALDDLTDVDISGAVAESILIRGSDGIWYDYVVSGDILISSTGVATIQNDSVQASDIDWGSGADQVDASSVPLQVGGGETYSGIATNVQDALEELEAAQLADYKFVTIHTSTGTDPVADTTSDTLNIYGSGPIGVSGDSVTDTITVSLGVKTINNTYINWGATDAADVVNADDVPLNTSTGTYGGSATNVQDALEELEGLIGGTSVFNEKPAVVHNATTCTLANDPIDATLAVYVNGLRMEEGAGADYTVSGTTITFTFQLKTTPAQSDVVICDYRY